LKEKMILPFLPSPQTQFLLDRYQILLCENHHHQNHLTIQQPPVR
jgi:hypothetical protein